MVDVSSGNMPEWKRAAIIAATPADTTPEPEGLRRRPPAPDVGSPDDIQAVRVALGNGITRYKVTMALPQDIPGRLSIVNDRVAMERRLAPLREAFDSARADRLISDIERALTSVAADPTYRCFQDYRLIVKNWQGIQVTGDQAEAVFEASNSYKVDGSWVDDPVEQWQVSLVRSGGVWKIRSYGSVIYQAP